MLTNFCQISHSNYVFMRSYFPQDKKNSTEEVKDNAVKIKTPTDLITEGNYASSTILTSFSSF
jgi:hypothetical protein